ncbi:hypothetical protein HAX54_034346 [Datura stramonium]|uniref:Uncharacterized protein n=1 Tax=Datura stramonium TaxID=4076 RepID=A0ABS8VEK6_DATST|nr:hypothetical protein [Datura stramonium]
MNLEYEYTHEDASLVALDEGPLSYKSIALVAKLYYEDDEELNFLDIQKNLDVAQAHTSETWLPSGKDNNFSLILRMTLGVKVREVQREQKWRDDLRDKELVYFCGHQVSSECLHLVRVKE